MRHATEKATRNSKGSATVEFVMAIPLLALVIAGILFFGWAMRNHQRLRAADRQAAWRSVEGAPPTGSEVDTDFFAGRGEETTVEIDAGPTEILEAFQSAARQESAAAGLLAEDLLGGFRVPRGRGATVRSRFATGVEFWRRLAPDAMDSRHVREGPDWQRGQTDIGGAMRERYFQDLEQNVDRVAGSNMSRSLRNLYQNGW